MNKKQIVHAQKPTVWDLSNQILYNLCREHPEHTDDSIIITKIMMIGRIYSAAIERRKKQSVKGDDFYIKNVAPIIRKSSIDKEIQRLSGFKHPDQSNLAVILEVHKYVMELFKRISGLEKRSLASKYLHFHKPDLFYIYDSRAKKGMRRFANSNTKLFNMEKLNHYDKEYTDFLIKCILLNEVLGKKHRKCLNPREIDNLLIGCS
ncbi:MAG: hypothetical protein PHQ23_16275 [Candidatus Wallbacteria bacterium]|nr:hypothetical protein [Candidatus Wallbacteria bacterium]